MPGHTQLPTGLTTALDDRRINFMRIFAKRNKLEADIDFRSIVTVETIASFFEV